MSRKKEANKQGSSVDNENDRRNDPPRERTKRLGKEDKGNIITLSNRDDVSLALNFTRTRIQSTTKGD